MVDQLKNELKDFYVVFDIIEATSDVYEDESKPLKERFFIDMMQYIMYLSFADGKITTEEQEFMNGVFEQDFTIEKYKETIHLYGIGEEKFENTMPYSLQILNIYDKKMNEIEDGYHSPKELILDFMRRLGEYFIACDGEITEEEKENLSYYISNIGGNNIVDKPIPKEVNKKVDASGMYRIGIDLPQGKYKLTADSDRRAYYSISADANGEDIILNDNFFLQAYISVKNGQFLELSRCAAVGFDIADRYIPRNGKYFSGEYLVGEEIKSGSYRIVPKEERGYYSIECFDENEERQIILNRNISGKSYYIDIRDGQILVLSNCVVDTNEKV